MIINKAKASSYNSITSTNLVVYIKDYQAANQILLQHSERLENCDRTQLKAIAAELETVNKRLQRLINNRY